MRLSTVFLILVFILSACKSAAPEQHDHLSSTALPHNIPDFCANPTVSAKQDGNWSSTQTWTKPLVDNDVLEIPSGRSVTLDVQSETRIKCLAVKGTLRFHTDTNTRLRVGTLMIFEGGRLEVGTTSTPIASTVTAEIIINNQAIDKTKDPESYGTGILGFGHIVMVGEAKTSYLRLASEALAGATTFTLASTPKNWRTGDRLVLPSTAQGSSGLSNTDYTALLTPAQLTLQTTSGTSVSVTQGLSKAHIGARNYTGNISFLPHLGNLTRNIIIRSENPNGTRGHVLFTHRADIDLRYVLFKDLGRTTIQPLSSSNQIGRYALHLHHLMGITGKPAGSYQYVLLGNAIDSSSKWGITLHDTHYGLVRGNIMFNTPGAGIMTEDGSESFNVIGQNYILYTIGTGEERGDSRFFQNSGDWGFEGSGIWLRGPNNYVRNNIVANSNSFAYTVMPFRMDTPVRIPKFPGADTTIASQTTSYRMQQLKLLEFTNNTAYASRSGVTFWDTGSNANDVNLEVKDLNGNVADNLVKTMSLWHINRYGFYGYGVNRVTFDTWRQYGDVQVLADSSYNNPIGLFFSDYPSRNLKVLNSDFQGLRTAILIPGKAGDNTDEFGNTPSSFLVKDSFFSATRGIQSETAWSVHSASRLVPRRIEIENTKFQDNPGNPGYNPFYPTDVGKNIHYAIAPTNDLTGDYGSKNFVLPTEFIVTGFNRVLGDNFRVFAREQAPNVIVPTTNIQAGKEQIGIPAAGLTNVRAWSKYGKAIGGAVAPCVTTRVAIHGFVCP
jgi:G8 domain